MKLRCDTASSEHIHVAHCASDIVAFVNDWQHCDDRGRMCNTQPTAIRNTTTREYCLPCLCAYAVWLYRDYFCFNLSTMNNDAARHMQHQDWIDHVNAANNQSSVALVT